MISAVRSSVSALNAASRSFSARADNIANVRTTARVDDVSIDRIRGVPFRIGGRLRGAVDPDLDPLLEGQIERAQDAAAEHSQTTQTRSSLADREVLGGSE